MCNKISRKAKKYFEYLLTKIKVGISQRYYEADGVKIKYILEEKKDTNVLVVVLSSCTRLGVKARYNYMRTLKKVKVNKLFILDDFGPDGRGSYYIGKNYSFCEDAVTKRLIENMIRFVGAEKIIFTGSSKGGWAALNFGLQFENSYIVAGAPQYYVASWFGNSATLDYIVGEKTSERLEYVNHYLERRIKNNAENHTQKIYLHYSDSEHTYEEHIRNMVFDLLQAGFSISEDVEHYENHSDVSLYFPSFMVKTIMTILEQKKC